VSLRALILTGSVLSAALLVSSWTALGQAKPAAGTGAGLSLLPGSGVIDGSYGYQTLSAVLNGADGSGLDVTPRATLTSSNPAVVRIENGIALPVGDGQAEVVASFGGQTARTKLTVKNAKTDAGITFPNDVTPILLKSGCNGSACHGAANGQAGFKLSLFGYDPDKDREAFWTADKGRRVDSKDPANSMVLLKPLGVIPHSGGKRFAKGGPEYRTLLAWIRAGGPLYGKEKADKQARGQAEGETRRQGDKESGGVKLVSLEKPGIDGSKLTPVPPPTLETISVLPTDRTIKASGSTHQLIVTAHYADGSTRDVTPLARYFSDDEGIASASSVGKVTAVRDGEANVMVRYNGKATVSRLFVLTKPRSATYPKTTENNFIDTHVFAKLKKMGISPAPLTADAEFIRRVSLDIAGVLPNSVAVRKFVEDKASDKRAKLIDDLLERPEYQDVMTIEWSELLRINRLFLQEQGVRAYTAFVRDSIAENKPFDQFVREIVGSATASKEQVEKSRDAEGRTEQALYRECSGYHSGPVNYYRVTADPTELTTSTSQIFLGVRLDCCRCHNHPFDRWSMKDFYGFAAYFAGTGYTGGKVKDEITIFTDKNGEIRNPRNNQVEPPKPLTAPAGEKDTVGDRHKRLAEWITSPDNPFFAKATVNRFWKHFFGRGIVHPVDDFRATNPPINEPLLDALAKDFVANKYDIKRLIRTICNSRTYQLSDKTDATNESDTKNFSHYYSKRLGPEVLFDAIVTSTGVPENFGRANAVRATNLPDNSVGSYFLDVFGRSRRLQVQERSDLTSMSQALHLMNGGTINDRIANPTGKVAGILKTQMSPSEAIEEIYLSTLCRWPTEKEKQTSLYYLKTAESVKEGYEDMMWAILNSREFIFNH
jgi:hypothetical protein